MANQWLRLWHDMPTDPKWRTIAKVSKQRIGDVMAVYLHMLVTASNATERGRTQSFSCEDVASAIDLETADVAAIVDAMQGRVLEGDRVSGWEKRQAAREDGSAERAKAWREEQKALKQTQQNEAERIRTQTERDRTTDKDKSREEKNKEKGTPGVPGVDDESGKPAADAANTRGTRLADDWSLPQDWLNWATSEMRWPVTTACNEAAKFADYWHAMPGAKGRKVDWLMTWRNWCRNSKTPAGRTSPQVVDIDARNAEARRLLGFDSSMETIDG